MDLSDENRKYTSMKICVLSQTLNARTGAGVFTGGIVDGVKRGRPDIEFSVITSEDYIKPSFYHLLKTWSRIRDEIKKSDMAHALDGYPYGVVACLANIGLSRPIIITAIGSGSIRKLGGIGWRSWFLRWAYRRATRVTAISRYVAGEINKVLPDLSIEVINPGVDYNFYAGRSDELKTATEYEYIVTQGEFKRRKGYEEILPIIKEVMAVRHDLRYVIVANESRNETYRDKLYKLMTDLGIRDKVTIRSNLSREELRETYRNARLYLTLPTNVEGDVEGFGMAIMEAAAAGTPAVVGKGSGADDAVLDGQSGFLVDGGDRGQVVEQVLSIINDQSLREKLSNGAKQWASDNSWESKVKQYIDLYEKI